MKTFTENAFLEVMLRRKNQVYIPDSILSGEIEINLINETDIDFFADNEYTKLIFAFCENINGLGYMPTMNFVKLLFNIPLDYLSVLLHQCESNLIKITGADKTYEPMYKNFPEEVMKKDDVELYANAFIHYVSEGKWMPESKEIERQSLNEDITFTYIDACFDNDLISMFKNIMQSKTSISETDKRDLLTFFKEYPKALKYIPSNIPFKENASFVAKNIFDNISSIHVSDEEIVLALSNFLKTATDILRFVTEISNGDTSLASPTKYVKLSRPKRKLILALLERTNNIEEDMKRYSSYWIRLGEMLHPTEHQKRFPKTAKAFYKIRNNIKIDTFNSKLAKCYKAKDFLGAINLLKNRAGEFARNLDYILRNVNSDDINTVLNTFKSIANTIATPLLLQLRSHFLYRNDNDSIRVAFPKGQLAKSHLITNIPETISEDICRKVVKICDMALISNYSTREMLGNVYISEELKSYIVPFSQRNASDMKKIITRGSRIKLNCDFVRAFIWWTNNYTSGGRTDIDLSASFLDENYRSITHCSFTNLRDTSYKYVHSGDITDGGSVEGKGAAEFIDIDLDCLNDNGIKYVAFQVYNYTGVGFDTMINCNFGFMARNDILSGEIFEPSTVVNRMSITSNSNRCIPCVIDVSTNELVWIDMAGGLPQNSCDTLESNLVGSTLTAYGLMNMVRPTMFDTVLINAIARGEIVDNKEDADIIFDYDYNYEDNSKYLDNPNKNVRVVTPYDIDVYMSDLI